MTSVNIKSIICDIVFKHIFIKSFFVFHSTLEKLNVQCLEIKQIAAKAKFMGEIIGTINLMPAL